MRGPNRYPKPDRKNDVIQVRVTKQDRDLIEGWAREKGVTAAAYIRAVVFNRSIELAAA